VNALTLTLSQRERGPNRGRIVSVVTVALVVGAAAATAGALWRSGTNDQQALAVQARTIAQLQTEVRILQVREGAQADWTAVAAAAEPSVVTISTDEGLGSGWVAHSDSGGSDIVTNFHVVEDAVAAGVVELDVQQFDRVMHGTVVRVDQTDDLAVVHVREHLPALAVAAARPAVASTVMAIGSPLGLSGSVSVGFVSDFRSLFGSDYMQFSAPISPGNSGGPVVDQKGHVVAIATAKLVYPGAEGLGFAIPVQTACATLVVCAQA
jgi:putative serine protease PepD